MTLYMREQENRDIGREEGLAEGLEKGHAEGLAEGRASSIRNLMKNVGCDIDKAMDMLSVPIEEREMIKSLV